MSQPHPLLRFSLHGVTLALETNHPSFAGHLAARLAPRLPARPEAAPGIYVRLHWNARLPSGRQQGELRRWGRRLFEKDGWLLMPETLGLPGLQIAAQWLPPSFYLDAYYQPTGHFQAAALRLGRGRFELFDALSYYLVYFPFIHFFEQQYALYPLHAAAVERQGRAWLLPGLPGGGKTSLALAMLADPEVRLLSDNLVLYGSDEILALPEIIHLGSNGLIPAAAQERLINGQRSSTYQRREYQLRSGDRAWKSSLEAVFLISLSDQFGLHRIGIEEAVGKLVALDAIAKETLAYQQFAAPLEIIAPEPGQVRRRIQQLEKLMAGSLLYELTLERNAPLPAVIAQLEATVNEEVKEVC